MSPLRILHVYRTYYPDPPGGVQEAIRQIAVACTQLNIESRVFTLSPMPIPAEIKRPEAFVVRSKSWMAPASCDFGGGAAIRSFAKWAKWADVIHYHFPWPFADMMHLINRPKAPAVMTYHSDIIRQRWLGRVYTPLMYHMLRSMSAVVATSPSYALTSPILSDVSLSGRTRIIPLGINESAYCQSCDNGVLLRLHLNDSEPFLLFIGVLRYYKGLHTLMQAARSINVRLVIAGSGPEESGLRKLASQLGLRNAIFAGQVSDAEKVALIKNCRALVLPSHLRSEAYGMVLVEASMFGKPMISCEIGTGTSFVNVNGKTGLVVPAENPIDLASAMSRLADDNSLALQYGKAARIRYDELFSGRALGQAYSDTYREVVESRKVHR